MDPLDFLRLVWDAQGEGFVFLSFKDTTGGWHDLGYSYPGDEIELPDASLGDVYFAPNLFKVCKRREEHVKKSCWLYADLDTVNPREISHLATRADKSIREDLSPSIAWESSPNRFQAMWKLDEHIKRKRHKEMNQHLSYLIGADKGGWDITQVLRVPGTINHKYEEKPEVRLLWT
jgi:hypothetical protein